MVGISRAEQEASLSSARQKRAVLLFSCCVMVVGPSGQVIFDAQLRETRLCNFPARVVSGRPSGNMSLHLPSSAMRLKEGVQPG